VKFNCKNLTFVVVTAMLFLIGGCIDLPTDLKVPQWDVDLNLPIVNRTYTLNDIIKKQNYISIQGSNSTDSIYVIQSDTYSQSTTVSNFIQLNGVSSSVGNIIPAGVSGSIAIYLPIPAGAELDNAVFTKGLLSLHIVNPNLQTATLNIAFPGILQNGSELNIPMSVPPLQQDSVQRSLAGFIYKLPTNQANRGVIQIIVSAAASSLPLISFVTMDIYSSDFNFSTATGNLPSKSLGVKSQSFSLNLGNAQDYRDKASLKYGSLNLDVKYYSPVSNPFGIKVKNLNIIGLREDGSQIVLKDSTGSPNITFNIGSGTTHLTFSEANSNITSFISFLPGKILLSAEYIMNPDNLTATVTDQDSIVFSTNFSTRSVLAIKKSIITDTASINISDKDTLKIQDAKSAYINVNIQNGIPLDSWLTIKFVDSLYHPLFLLTNSSNADSIFFASANVNSAGEVTSEVTTNNIIRLDSLQTVKLSRARYVIYSAAVQTNGSSVGSNGNFVSIRPNDKLQINVYGGIKYHINTDDLKSGGK
jgi:hypothetical protein